MEWTLEDGAHPAGLQQAAGVHHRHAVAGPGYHAQVVGDQDHRRPTGPLQAADQVEDLRLDGDVEGGGRLVGDDQVRLGNEGHGDDDALPHAAGQLVRETARPRGRILQADLGERRLGARPRLPAPQAPVTGQRLGQLRADPQVWVERRHRVLEDHADAPAADLPQVALAAGEQVGPIEAGTAALQAPRRAGDEPEQGQASHALARAGFAHDAERLAAVQAERDAFHGAHDAVARVEVYGQVLDLEQRHPFSPRKSAGRAHRAGRRRRS